MSGHHTTHKYTPTDEEVLEHLLGDDKQSTTPTPGSTVSVKTLLIAAAIVAFAIWMTGALDKALVGAGLNKNDCAVTAMGETLCGNELDAQQDATDNARRELDRLLR